MNTTVNNERKEMYGLEFCGGCEKFGLQIETHAPIVSMNELPHTYDMHTKRFQWCFHEIAGYSLVPRSISGRKAYIDFYLCVDHRDAQSIDVLGYARRFFMEHMLPRWNNIKRFDLSQCVSESPAGIPCRRPQYFNERGMS